MTLTKKQQARYTKFCKKHGILGFGGLYYNKPCISLDVFAKNSSKIWITERSISGHNVGVHISVEGAAEITGGWAGMGWCLFGKEFIEQLVKEFTETFPEFADWVKGYDGFEYKPNYVRVFTTEEECKQAEIAMVHQTEV